MMTKAAELKTKSSAELEAMLLGLRKEQMNLRFQRATGQLANTARVTAVRKDIARISTLLSGAKKGSK
jgi:large subunit ribosomal protein L29